MIGFLKRLPASQRWLLFSLIPLAMFVCYTALVVNGNLDILMMHQEQWLMQRPITRFDCVVYQWKYFGEAPVSLVLVLLTGVVCWLLKYRLQGVFVLLLLFGAGLGVEYVGKQSIYQPLPAEFSGGLDALGCPQLWRVSRVDLIPLTLGAWWVAPHASPVRVAEARAASVAPFSLNASSDEDYLASTGYPSGHAYRWMLIGLVAFWLTWRQVRKRFWRRLLMLVFLALSFAGGFGLFYTGTHLFTDMVGGYLLGAFLACCAIVALCAGERRNRWSREKTLTPLKVIV